jgi:hypothetical protein
MQKFRPVYYQGSFEADRPLEYEFAPSDLQLARSKWQSPTVAFSRGSTWPGFSFVFPAVWPFFALAVTRLLGALKRPTQNIHSILLPRFWTYSLEHSRASYMPDRAQIIYSVCNPFILNE